MSLYDEFRAFEQEHGLFDRVLGDVHFWELTRYDAFIALTNERGDWERLDGKARDAAPPTPIERAREIATQLPHLLHGHIAHERRSLLIAGHPRRKRLDDGTYWDIFLDPVADHCRMGGRSLLYVEKPHRGRFHYQPAHTPDLVYLDRHIHRARVRLREWPSLRSSGQVGLAAIAHDFRRRFGSTLALDELVRGRVRRFEEARCMWQRIFARVRPRAVLFVVGTGEEGLVAAARGAGVLAVELQHGTPVAGKINYDYNQTDKPRRYFADYFLAYGRYWKERNEWPIASERIVELGYPFFQDATAALRDTPKEDLTVFLSQPTIGPALARMAAEVRRVLDRSERVVYKLHPEEIRDWRTKYPVLVDAGVEVVGDTKDGLYELLARARDQVGVYSTAMYEGLALGCRTLLADLPGVELMRDLVDRDMALILRDARDFPTLRAKLKTDTGQREAFFGSDWRARLEGFLREHVPS